MNDKVEQQRVYWQSRRGMLELDLALMPFVKKVYPQLPVEEQAMYQRLLECEDSELFAWVLQKERPQDADLAYIMDRIIANARQTEY